MSEKEGAIRESQRQFFGQLKQRIGSVLAYQFLKHNDGKFHAALEMNPAVHALTELFFAHLKPEPVVSQDQEELWKEAAYFIDTWRPEELLRRYIILRKPID